MGQQNLDHLPRYELGPFADDCRHFVNCVLGMPRAKALKPGAAVPEGWYPVAVLIGPEIERVVVIDELTESEPLRDEAAIRAAQAEAEQVHARFIDEIEECERKAQAADEAIEEAHDKIREGEYELTEAKHQLRAVAQRRDIARTRYRLEMENVAGFGRARPG